MEYMLHFAYLKMLYVLLPVCAVLAWVRWRYASGIRYVYPLADTLHKQGLASRHPYKIILYCMRLCALVGLALLIAKPQLVDPRSHVKMQGIDIVIALDVSGSMSYPHHADDPEPRIDVAKREAIRFIDKRDNDAIGIVIFANDALTLCPLTADKMLLKKIVDDLALGVIDYQGTLISAALIMAENRLKHSTAKSKVIILLTDGDPSPDDRDPQIPLAIAKELGIKIYTIGIGSNQTVKIMQPFGPILRKTTLNKPLLKKIAHETGGRFFEAKKPSDMRVIYDTIDQLEKTEIEAPVFSHYHDYFLPFVWCVFCLVLLELFLASFVWFSL